ncbi:mitochondrial large ribosomal subunit [Malassezia pachydermatis]
MRYAHSEAKPDAPAKQDLPSAAPAGTVFTGLSIYKDKPDPVARPDNEYPSWLWDLLEDPAVKPKKALMVGDVDTTGMSKGEARVALKRAAKMARAAARKQAAEEAKEKARWERMTDAQRAAVTARAKAEKDDKPKTATQMFEQERTKRRELRKANRAAIKASNFVRSA